MERRPERDGAEEGAGGSFAYRRIGADWSSVRDIRHRGRL